MKRGQEEMPWICLLKKLLGERTNVNNHTINNSSQSIDLTSVPPDNSRRAARSGSENQADVDPEAATEKDMDAEGDENVIAKIGVPKIAVTAAPPRKYEGKQKETRDPALLIASRQQHRVASVVSANLISF